MMSLYILNHMLITNTASQFLLFESVKFMNVTCLKDAKLRSHQPTTRMGSVSNDLTGHAASLDRAGKMQRPLEQMAQLVAYGAGTETRHIGSFNFA